MGGTPFDLTHKALRVNAVLTAHYGEPKLKKKRPPLDELVMTILSQNTNDTNSGRAFASLQQRFPTWQAVLDAPSYQVAEAIRVGGLANIKAPRIQTILRKLQDERGELSLQFLDDLPLEESRAYLNALPGVGPKTTACVLLFALHKPVMPVDTHVHRIALKLGLIPAKTSAEKAHVLLETLLPPALYYPFHLNLIHHGRTLCGKARPQCEACPLQEECVWLRENARAMGTQETQ